MSSVICKCTKLADSHGTLYPLYNHIWTCGKCGLVTKTMWRTYAKRCVECLGRFSTPENTNLCKSCDPDYNPKNSWTYALLIKQRITGRKIIHHV